MKKKEFKKIKFEEYPKKLSELKRELMILHGQSKTGTPPKNPGQIKNLKKNIARIKTAQNKKVQSTKN